MVQFIKKAIIRTFLFSLAFLLVLVIGLLTALQIPAIQTLLANKAAKKVSETLRFPVSIRHVHIEWLDKAIFEDVVIIDRQNKQMIAVPELNVDFKVSSLLSQGNINLDEVTLINPQVKLIKNKINNTLNIDEFIIAINELTRSKDTTRTGTTPVFSIDRVKLQDAFFSYADERKDSIRDGFDYQHIAIDKINANAFDFRIAADTIEINIEKLSGIDGSSTNLDVKELRTFFRYTKTSMLMANLYASIGNSIIRDFLSFGYADPSDLSDFNNKITVTAHLDSTDIDSKDLALFAPYLHRYQERWVLSGDMQGKVTRFRLRDADFRFGKNSYIKGDISFDGLPAFNETFIDFELRPSVLEVQDLQQYIPDEQAYEKIRKFGHIDLSGKFLGFPKDFVANGTFDTDLGKVISDVNLKLKEESANSTYQGKLITYGFNIGELLDQRENLQLLDMNGRIKGKGFSIKDASVDMNATIRRLGVRDYDYRNIKVNGKLSRQRFIGNLAVKDTNLVFTANGELDLRNGKNLFDIDADLKRANLKSLKLADLDATISTKLNVNFQGIKIDDIVGEASFTEASVLYNNRDLILDSMYVKSSKNDEGREFYLDSDLLSADIKGNFDFTNAYEDLAKLLNEYKLNFISDAAAAQSYYNRKSKEAVRKYSVQYKFDLKDITPLVSLFDPHVYISKNTQLDGLFSNGITSVLAFNSAIDTLLYKENQFFDTEIDVSTSKLSDSSNVLASAYIYSDRQKFGTVPATEALVIEAIWADKRIEFESHIKQTASTNYADLKGDLTFADENLLLRFKPSHFQLLENDWHISANNIIRIKGKNISFENVAVANRYQMISINGMISDSTSKAVEITIKDFNLQTLNPILGRDLQGITNGFIVVKDFYKDLNFQSDLNIEEMVLDKFLIGDITGQTNWELAEQRINVNYQVYRMGNKILNLAGFYAPNANENALNMRALLNRTDLEILEPFFRSQVSNLGGTASGSLNISGTLASPILKGNLMVNDGRFKYNYLNTTYHFEDKVYFSENEIGVRELQLMDDENNIAFIKGGVFHDGFKDFVLDLRANMQSFKVLNTTAKDNDLFYGTAIATGNLEILGAVSNLTITANARSNKGTKIFIPIGGTTKGIEQQEYIQFVTKSQQKDTSKLITAQQLDLSGLKLDFNFEVTPDAYCEIIFDLKAGDIIRGNGNGKIRMEIDTKGDFTMFGDYVISRGAYNFTLLNAINKEFKVRPGSRISWSGDPYGGLLDINATYEQTASLLPILNDPNLEGPEYSRRYPVTVLLNLTGDLLSPEIDLGIEFNSYPQNVPIFRTAIPNYQARLLTDEQELNRQVFSLMVLRKLSPEGDFSGVQGSVGNSVSELLSNQLSYWASQVDENLEIDLDLNGLDEDAFNTFQLRLSYSLFDGRLRVTRDGGFTNAQNQSDAMSVIGDWTVEYMLSKDGRFRLKMYNRNTQNILHTNSYTNTMAGFSLLHIQSFNTLKELFYLKKKPQVQPTKEEEPAPEPEKEPAEDEPITQKR